MIGNLISYALPLLMQAMIDRVIAYRAWNTLAAVAAVFVLLALFDAGFGYVRQRLSQIAGGRIDAHLGAESVAHLLSLPMTLFETTPAGVLARNIQQTDRIRQFLTGRLLQTLLDAALLPVLFATLAFLSGRLALVIAAYGIAIAACIALMLPLLQRRLNAVYAVEAERQALLVETLHNMRAVKSLAVEPARGALWEESLALSVRRQWDLGRVSAVTSTLTSLLERLMQVSVVAFGVALALEGAITVGTLVAVLMLAGRVSGPLVQIVGLVNEWQEAALSIGMLRRIMDHPPERPDTAALARPALTGALEIRGELRLSRRRHARARSGEPRHRARAGDRHRRALGLGQDHAHPAHPGHRDPAGRADPVRRDRHPQHRARPPAAAGGDRAAGQSALPRHAAREYRPRPPRGRARGGGARGHPRGGRRIHPPPAAGLRHARRGGGANLSGGQRQRVAIARALLTDPRILILDEATSALDPESEAVVNRNLAAIARGRTMIVVSHRLSSLVRADRIAVLDQGRLVAFAPHEALLAGCEIYAHLWRQQTEHLS